MGDGIGWAAVLVSAAIHINFDGAAGAALIQDGYAPAQGAVIGFPLQFHKVDTAASH